MPAGNRTVRPDISARRTEDGGLFTDERRNMARKQREVNHRFATPVIASAAEIVQARKLRQLLEQQYLDQPTESVCPWCVGAD